MAPFVAPWTAAAETVRVLDRLRRAGLGDPLLAAAGSCALLEWGPSVVVPFEAAARRHPRRAAIVDHAGTLSYAALKQRTDAMAAGLAGNLAEGAAVGLLSHNHRGFVEAYLASAKLGAPVVLLNTGFAAPQLAGVVARERVGLVLHDLATAAVVADATPDLPAIAVDAPAADPSSLAAVAERSAGARPARPRSSSQPVLLTSGTTGTPKGARRQRLPRDPRLFTGLLGAIPYRAGDVIVCPAPLFHAWGFSQLLLAGALGATLVLRPEFDPAQTVADVAAHRATVLAAVPVMLQRILALDDAVGGSAGAAVDGAAAVPAAAIDATAAATAAGSDRERDALASLRVVASSGSALPGRLAGEWMARFGDHLYNLYGSTEVGQATVAGPADLHAAPGTAGRPLPGVSVRIVDDRGRRVPNGNVGRIMVGNPFRFDGYTGGGTKAVVNGRMATGDLGYLDERGRLYVGGRDDDMIVSGGENVFPREVEDLLIAHPGVADAAVVGVDDDAFGQRLAAFVVRTPGVDLDAAAVKRLVRERLARHKVPRDVVFVDQLPRNPTGKVLRRELVRRIDAG